MIIGNVIVCQLLSQDVSTLRPENVSVIWKKTQVVGKVDHIGDFSFHLCIF